MVDGGLLAINLSVHGVCRRCARGLGLRCCKPRAWQSYTPYLCRCYFVLLYGFQAAFVLLNNAVHCSALRIGHGGGVAEAQ